MNQARALGSSFASLPIKAIFSSPLKRAHTTAMQILEQQDPKPAFEESVLLKEQHFGVAEGHPWAGSRSTSSTAMKDHYPPMEGRNGKFPEGESRDDVGARASQAIDLLIMPRVLTAQGMAEQASHVLVVAHGIFIAELLRELVRRRSGGANENPRFSGLVNTGWTRIVLGLEGETLDQVENEAVTTPSAPPVLAEPPTYTLFVKVIAINQAPHLTGLKRQRGGIGSSTYDGKQRTLRDFLDGKGQKE